MKDFCFSDTICAIATGGGTSAIAVIRISGKKSFDITKKIFDKKINNIRSRTIVFGNIKERNKVIDEVLISFFIGPNSYTGEDTVEISCHGSKYIQTKILQLIVSNGGRPAEPGEFTMRAFLNQKLDLSQAESVADLISSENKVAHQTYINQLKGGVSKKIKKLRDELVNFASLIELELDFSEEDVEFASRKRLTTLLDNIKDEIKLLLSSYVDGNILKEGIAVTILGQPNSGKSTLLNCILNEDRAITSDIAGTTRDLIEDFISIGGLTFRFTDTAGLRQTKNKIENIGIKKAIDKSKKSNIIINLIDATQDVFQQINYLKNITQNKKSIFVLNKTDLKKFDSKNNIISISAKKNLGIDELKKELLKICEKYRYSDSNIILTNTRHLNELNQCLSEINLVLENINKVSSDLISINIRKALGHLGNITGEITTDDLLGNIFSNFCIGK
tara:strand:+ start:32 stop:1375 length:1344 start_codon:yes stop_codon:yes gene_type:complete